MCLRIQNSPDEKSTVRNILECVLHTSTWIKDNILVIQYINIILQQNNVSLGQDRFCHKESTDQVKSGSKKGSASVFRTARQVTQVCLNQQTACFLVCLLISFMEAVWVGFSPLEFTRALPVFLLDLPIFSVLFPTSLPYIFTTESNLKYYVLIL